MLLLKKISLGLLLFFIIIQIYRPELEKKPAKNSSSFEEIYNVPMNIRTILKNSCYDCHSNNSNFPWYSKVQPIKLLIDNHVSEGVDNLNFSEFGNYSDRKKANKIKSMISQIESNDMPLRSYTLLHSKASLNESKKNTLLTWLKQLN